MSRPLFLPLSTHLYRIDLNAYWSDSPVQGDHVDKGEADEMPAVESRAEPISQRHRRPWTFFPTASRLHWFRPRPARS